MPVQMWYASFIAVALCAAASNEGGRVTPTPLWQEGDDPYQTLVAVIGHHGSCQPSCLEQRTLVVPQNVFYKVKIEVAQVDMHSDDELVTVKVGGQEVTCSPSVASDYNCSLVECRQLNFGRVVHSELRIEVEASKTRDTCKCSVSADEVDCYSELLSGLDPTYGALVRLSFEPQVRSDWVLGSWSHCSRADCIAEAQHSERSVQCRMYDPEDVGDGGDRCSAPRPLAQRPCSEAPECQAPPACDGCFYIAQLSDVGMNWSAILMRPGGANHVQVGEIGRPVQLQLLLGLAHVSCDATLLNLPEDVAKRTACVSLSQCGDRGRLLTFNAETTETPLDRFEGLVLAEDDGSPKFRMSATFHLRQVATAGYILANPYSAFGVGTPAFALLRDLPSYIDMSQVAQLAANYNATCAFQHWALVPPRELCQEADGFYSCPDADDGAFGRCCIPGDCPSDAAAPDCEKISGRFSVAYVTSGQCEDVRCSAIESRQECLLAAKTLGFPATTGPALRMSQRLPSFCSWESATADNGSPALWLNRPSSAGGTAASVQSPQLCRCQKTRRLRRYQWRVAAWSVCSRSCGKQRRYRKVNCHELLGIGWSDDESGESSHVVPAIHCREAGLEEPPSSEPCSTEECWMAQEYTRCAGSNRILDAADLVDTGAWLVKNGNDTTTYCVAMNASSVAAVAASVVPERNVNDASGAASGSGGSDGDRPAVLDLVAAAELCRKICSQLGRCVGFTFFDHVFGDRNVAQCCFLRRATRWQHNFRRATCHLARGAQTRSGCFCQVGWAIDDAAASTCGPDKGGCCTSPDSGAVSWCPTASASCDAQLPNQQHADLCHLRDVATVSEHTCRTHPDIQSRQCASARGISECNQIATVLDLPDRIPEVELSMNMPSGCVWQKATSKLWLNPVVDVINASDPTQKVTMSASEDMAELCLCKPTEEYSWEVGEWRPCYKSMDANCHGARKRTRAAHCVRADALETWRYQVVADSECPDPRPPTMSPCSECDRQVVAAIGEFHMPEPVPGLQASNFAKMTLRNLASAAQLDESERMSVGQVDCCTATLIRLELRITDGSPGAPTGVQAMDELLRISRSARARTQEVSWIDQSFGNMMQYFTLTIRGTYAWEVSDSWGSCSENCGGGIQSRQVWCSFTDGHDVTVVRDENCHAASRPSRERSCGTRPCRSCSPFQIGPQYVVSRGDNKVYVTCAAGYESVDDIRLVESECKDGEWTPLAVTCGRNCSEFGGRASWKYNVTGRGKQHGSTRQVTCKRREASENSGVETAVSASVTCQDGAWTSPSLVCTGDCLTPELSSAYEVSQINGTSEDNVAQVGTVWQISCAPGFSTPGDDSSVTLECERGSWSGLQDIPDCKADCPRYKLSEGYEIVGDDASSRLVTYERWPQEDGSSARQLVNLTGPHHGTRIGIRCVEGYGRVPGAVERVQCNDGQWSPLSLSCSKDCQPFNTSSLEFSRFRVIVDMSRSGDPIMDDAQTDAPHGSKIIIGCKIDKKDDSMKRGEVTCDNGRWIPSDLRCFRDCAAFVPGPEYSALIPGALASQRNRSVPHGTQLLATCAQGFSALPTLAPNSSQGPDRVRRRRVTTKLIAESECVDGIWTDLTLQCFPDCPSWPMRQRTVMDSGGGLRVGSLLRLACDGQPEVAIRCGMRGIWELLSESNEGKEGSKFTVGPKLSAEKFASMCPLTTMTSRKAVMKMTFWAKLSDDERAMFMILALGCFGSLCGLACTYFLSPYVPDEPVEEDALGDSETPDEAAEDGGRRFNLLTGEVERRRRGRRKRSTAQRLSLVVQRNANRLAGYLQDGSPKETACSNCQRPASHVCFPCSHLCLCVACADDFLQTFPGQHGPQTSRGFQDFPSGDQGLEDSLSVAGQPSCPLCGQFVFCVIDAKPAQVFEMPGPLDLAVSACTAAASSLRKTALYAVQGAADAARRGSGVAPTTVGRSREERPHGAAVAERPRV